MHVEDLKAFSDSQLVVGHINGSYEARDPTIALYLTEVRWLAGRFGRLLVVRSFEFGIVELSFIVSDDDPRDPKPGNDVLPNEFLNLLL